MFESVPEGTQLLFPALLELYKGEEPQPLRLRAPKPKKDPNVEEEKIATVLDTIHFEEIPQAHLRRHLRLHSRTLSVLACPKGSQWDLDYQL
ncbi:hypothetical protein CSKR_200545 [Clonorchis sinensis]|uniref:Uncharacterized protein n=1 Tax=Clonorchis sinensis TaxID=79923 RepID=A0A8T1MEK0_CLOSI|nr:hypothetical protein CSKR_200545 [Clonorchis sinensis]